MAAKVRDLIGNITLDDALVELGREAREADAADGMERMPLAAKCSG